MVSTEVTGGHPSLWHATRRAAIVRGDPAVGGPDEVIAMMGFTMGKTIGRGVRGGLGTALEQVVLAALFMIGLLEYALIPARPRKSVAVRHAIVH